MHRLWILLGMGLVLLTGTRVSAEVTMHAEQTTQSHVATATFAGGCFWCMEPPFEKLEGVISVTSGYCGGTEPKPTYEQVSAGRTGYAESVQVIYDPARVTYDQLLEAFWMNIDPTQSDGQFADRGRQYRTAIFYHTDEQQRLAEASKERLATSRKFSKPIVTAIAPATQFYPAEDDHQDYYKKNPLRYKLYRAGSGREGFLTTTWGDPSAGGGH